MNIVDNTTFDAYAMTRVAFADLFKQAKQNRKDAETYDERSHWLAVERQLNQFLLAINEKLRSA